MLRCSSPAYHQFFEQEAAGKRTRREMGAASPAALFFFLLLAASLGCCLQGRGAHAQTLPPEEGELCRRPLSSALLPPRHGTARSRLLFCQLRSPSGAWGVSLAANAQLFSVVNGQIFPFSTMHRVTKFPQRSKNFSDKVGYRTIFDLASVVRYDHSIYSLNI